MCLLCRSVGAVGKNDYRRYRKCYNFIVKVRIVRLTLGEIIPIADIIDSHLPLLLELSLGGLSVECVTQFEVEPEISGSLM